MSSHVRRILAMDGGAGAYFGRTAHSAEWPPYEVDFPSPGCEASEPSVEMLLASVVTLRRQPDTQERLAQKPHAHTNRHKRRPACTQIHAHTCAPTYSDADDCAIPQTKT